jgi:hypothetical protein
MLVAIEAIASIRPSNVYGDESVQTDKDDNREFYAVTAYVGSFDSWIKTENEWQAVLAAYGISEFHTTDFLP